MAEDMEVFPVDAEDDDLVVTLDLDDGSRLTCEILTIFECEDREYIVLLPQDKHGNPNSDGQVYIYRYEEAEDGTPSLDNIASDEEYDKVAAAFEELYYEDEDDEDEE